MGGSSEINKMKQLTLFGEDMGEITYNRGKRDVFYDYEHFVKKFKEKGYKQTTDDCYTPKEVYAAILEWVGERVSLSGRPIVRPFYPGVDYKNAEYPDECVVVDNPPFSILAEICRFYLARKIDFFLFGPGLTLFQDNEVQFVIIDVSITYHNGAEIPTGFITTLFGGRKLILSRSLSDKLREMQGKPRKERKKEEHVPYITSATARKYIKQLTGDVRLDISSEKFLRKNANGGDIFGCGYILTDEQWKEIGEVT